MKTSHYALVCALLLGSIAAFAQTITPPAPKSRTDANELIPNTAVAPDAPVITIKGLCERPANSSATPADCSTVITRADFEKILSAIGANMGPAQRKTFAERYVMALKLAESAHEQGLDHGPEFEEQLYLQRLQVLDRLAQQQMQKDASNIPDSEIGDYFQQHAADYKTISVERILVPKQKQIAATEQKPAGGGELEKERQASEAEMKSEADKLRARAAAGEDFVKLQQEAYDFAGSKMKATNVKLEKIGKKVLAPADVSIFELKKGEVSEVFTDPDGYHIYKVLEVVDGSLSSAHDEILRTMQADKMKSAFASLDKSATTTYDDRYFAPPAAPSLKTPAASPSAGGPGPHPAPGKK